MNASALFTIAHQITRESVKRFGGDYRVTFAAALRIAYQESKMSIKPRFTVHPDWIYERLEEAQKNAHFSEIRFLCRFSNENPFLRLADRLGDEKISAIAHSVDEIESAQRKSYRRVTEKQRFALASALMNRYGSLDAVLSETFK